VAQVDDGHVSVQKGGGGGDDGRSRSVGHAHDLGYVEDGDAFLQQVVTSKTRLFAGNDKVAGDISEWVIEAKAPNYNILLASQNFATSMGRSAEELVGSAIWSLFGPLSDGATLDSIRSALARGLPISTAVRMYDKAHVPTWRHLYLEPVYDGKSNEPQLYVAHQLN